MTNPLVQRISSLLNNHTIRNRVIFGLVAVFLIIVTIGVTCFAIRKRKASFRHSSPGGQHLPETPTEILEYANNLADHQNYQNAERLYYDLIKRNEAPPEVYYYLAELNYARARGDRDPLLQQAANLYKHAILAGYIDCMIKLADIYNFCTVPNTDIPNKNVAKALYHKIVRHPRASRMSKVTANLRLTDLNRELALKMAHRTTRVQHDVPDDQILREHRIPIAPHAPVRPLPVQNIQNVVRNDSQNVHDRQIQQAFGDSIAKLKKLNGYNQHGIPQREIVQQIKDYINNSMDFPQQTKTKAMATINAMEHGNETIMSANGLRETEILGLVWNRIHARENEPNRDNLKEALAQELADATVNGAPVCATGRVTRAVNALEGTDRRDNLVRFRPKWALKEEIHGKAARVRDEVLNNATDEERDAYNNPNPTSPRAQNLANAITERMKRELLTRCTQEYVQPKLMTSAELENELREVNEAF